MEETLASQVRAVLKYDNVEIQFVKVDDYFKDTPIEQKFKNKKISSVDLAHAYRLIAMWKYGGVYLDMDFIVMKPLHSLPNNSACIQSYTYNEVNGAYLKMDQISGKRFSKEVLRWVFN